MHEGLLLVDKPAGWTSFDVVNYVRKQVAVSENKKPKHVKVGHTGTLDPFATGLLVLLIGKAYTRRAGELSKQNKTYEVTMRLGEESSTGDPEGAIKHVSNKIPETKELSKAVSKFLGEIEQTPPIHSAIKIGGQRAYKLARAGKEVEMKPRKVSIASLKITHYSYPEIKIVTNVSSGTYIRSLVEDIGRSLGTGAYTVALRRVSIGDFQVKDSVKLSDNIIDSIRNF